MFNKGDKVRRKAGTGRYGTSHEGSVHIVEWCDGGAVRFVGDIGWAMAESYELVEAVPTPHKHAEVIKAWADGAKVQGRYKGPVATVWEDCNNPQWRPDHEYRVKPAKKEDTTEVYGFRRNVETGVVEFRGGVGSVDNLALTFDGETGKLKAVAIL